MGVVERKTEILFYIVTGYNNIFHLVKLTLFFLPKDNDGGFFNKTVWDSIFVVSLAFLVILCGSRLLNVSRRFHVTAYKTHSA